MLHFYTMILLFISMILSGSGFANDAVSSQTLEGIVFSKTDAIALRKEKLFVSPKEIKVDYIFENTTSSNQNLLLSFPLPPIEANYMGNQETFESFSVAVDGKNVEYQTECRAFTTSGEVTEELKKLGLPICNFKKTTELTKEILAVLIKKKIYSNENVDEELNPAFSIHRKHYWTQTFLPLKKVQIQHKYRPLLGMNSIGQLSHSWSEFLPEGSLSICLVTAPDEMTAEQKAKCKDELKDSIDSRAYYLNYIITSANTWKNGIEDFELMATGAALILGEVDGKRDADFKELKLLKKNFKPKKEITIEFVGVDQDAVLPIGVPFYKIVDGPANCRSKPNGPIISSIPNLEKIVLRERKNDWYRVAYSGKGCWTKRTNFKFNF
jgi:hypothetical protein